MSAVLTPTPAAAGPVTQVRVIRSEWTKLRALRSTWYCALIAVVLIVGVGAAIVASAKPNQVSSALPAAAAVSVSL
jgi:ABC-2 type transport system permease protein